jgi:hypothetical protein
MKKLLAIAAATLAGVLLVAPVVRAGVVDFLTFQAGADAAQAVDPTLDLPPNDGARDFAVGGFRGFNGVNNVGFSAYSDPNGANPHGHLSQTIPAGKTSAQRRDHFTVTCLAVLENIAALGLTPSDAATAARFPDGRVLRVTDGGPGGALDLYGYDNGDASNCQNHLTGGTVAPESGNILVHDEP